MKKLYEESKIIAIANAIRTKGGVGTWTTAEMPEAILGLVGDEGLFMKLLNKTLTEVKIPYGTITIPEYFFYRQNIEEIELPSTLTTIGNSAFSYSKLINIEIPNSVTNIYNEAFSYCTDLESVRLPQNNQFTALYDTFKGCRKLTSIEIPDTITGIYYDTFMNTGITELTIPNSVTSISKLNNMPNVTKITLSTSLNPAYASALPTMSNCPELVTVENIPAVSEIPNNCFMNDPKINIEIPSSVTKINAYAFGSMMSETSYTLENPLYIPATVTTINSNAFKYTDGILNCGFSEGAVSGAPWGFVGTINYDVSAPTAE